MSYSKSTFLQRYKCLFDLENERLQKNLDYMICNIGEEEEVKINKSIALIHWLFDFDLMNLVAIFGKSSIYFLAADDDIKILNSILNNELISEIGTENSIKVELFKIEKTKQNKSVYYDVIKKMQNNAKYGTIGIFENHIYRSIFLDSWNQMLKNSKFKLVNISASVAHAMSIKDVLEIKYIHKASHLSCLMMCRYMDILDSLHSKLKNSSINNKIRNIDIAVMLGTDICQKKLFCSEDRNEISLSFFPLVQSGGYYNLNLESGSDKNDFIENISIVSIGIRYHSYCSAVIRTFIVMPLEDEELKENHELLIASEGFIIKNLCDGKKLSDLYNQTLQFINAKKSTLLHHVTKNFGSCIGLELNDPLLCISHKSDVIAKKNMIFNINIGFDSVNRIHSSDYYPEVYSLWIGDIVQVEEKGSKVLSDFPSSDTIFRRQKRF